MNEAEGRPSHFAVQTPLSGSDDCLAGLRVLSPPLEEVEGVLIPKTSKATGWRWFCACAPVWKADLILSRSRIV